MKKTMVYCLGMNGSTAIYLDKDSLCDSLKMETEDLIDEDLLEMKFEVSFKLMTDKELNELPEFNGF